MANQYPQQSTWQNAGKPETSSSLADRAEKAAEQVAGSAIERVQSAQTGLSQQRDRLAERIRRVGGMLRENGDQLRKEDEFVAEYLGKASDQVESVASYVTHADLATMADDIRSFVERRPAVFFGGAFVLGLAMARFLKASSSKGAGEQAGLATTPSGGLGSSYAGSTPRMSGGQSGMSGGQSGMSGGQSGMSTPSMNGPATGTRPTAPTATPGGSDIKSGTGTGSRTP